MVRGGLRSPGSYSGTVALTTRVHACACTAPRSTASLSRREHQLRSPPSPPLLPPFFHLRRSSPSVPSSSLPPPFAPLPSFLVLPPSWYVFALSPSPLQDTVLPRYLVLPRVATPRHRCLATSDSRACCHSHQPHPHRESSSRFRDTSASSRVETPSRPPFDFRGSFSPSFVSSPPTRTPPPHTSTYTSVSRRRPSLFYLAAFSTSSSSSCAFRVSRLRASGCHASTVLVISRDHIEVLVDRPWSTRRAIGPPSVTFTEKLRDES